MKDATTSKMRVTSKRKMQVMSTHIHVRSSNGRTLPACSRTQPTSSRTTICRMSVIVLLLTSLSLVPVSNATTYIGQTEGDVIDTTIPFTDTSSIYPTPSFTPAVALFCQPLGMANQTTVIAEMYWDVMSISTGITLYLNDTEMIQCNITANGCTYTKSNTYSVKGSSFEIFNWNLGYAVSFDVGFLRVETLNFSVMITAGGQVQNASCSSVHQSEPVDECVTQPDVCGHGGQCHDETLGFTCNCRPGYQGHTCSQSNNGVYCGVDQLTIHVLYHGLDDVCFTSSTPINCTIAGPAWNSSGDYSATLLNWKHVDPATNLAVAVNGSHLDRQLCLTPDSLPGINEVVYNITNPKASFDFTFTLTLDIQFNNTPPRFNSDMYTVAISSYKSVLVYVNKSSTVTCLNSPCIEVIDPDKNSKLGVSSLTLSVVRSNSGSSKIFFSNNNSSDSFGYFSFLNAPSENETFQLTAVDGQNASAQAEVKFEVIYPPVCPRALSIDHLDMLANGIITTLNCTEPEVGVYLSDTNYNVSSNMKAYFEVSSTGSIYVIKPLTSLAIGLYNFTITTVGKITDASGSTITTFSAQVPVSFNLTAPTPNCWLTDLTIPLMWKPSDIFKINLVCQNYSIDSLAIKSVTFSDGTVFNASKLEKSGNDNYSIDINLLQYKAGTYNCWVTATYGSEPSTTNTTIVVPDSPFQQIHDPTILVYTNASVGEMLWNISKELNFSLSLYLIEVEAQFPLIYLLDVNATTGIFTLAVDPNYYNIGNYTMVLRIIEINTSLYIDVNVTVRIVDVNEPPSCILTHTNISVNDVNTEIGYLNCTDPDTTDEYRNLDYSIEVAPSLPVNISSTGQIRLVGPVPSGISTALVTATVTDGTFSLNFPFQLYIFGCELTYITQRPLYWTRSTNVLLNLHCGTYNNGILKIYSNTTSPKQVFRVSEVYSNSTDVQLNLTQMEYRPDDYMFSVYVIINGVTVSTSLLIRVSNETTIMGGNRTILQNHNVTTPVFYISVTVDNSNPVLIFTITGDQHNLFKINQDEKSVYLNRTLSNDDVGIHEFNISVTDHSTSLTVWATFVVTVEDVNEAPTCTPPKVLVPLLSDENLFTPIVEINCTDPDRTEPFKSLNYMISTVPSSILNITEYTGIVFLAVELKYTNLSDTTIYATVNVISIDLSVSLTFSLTISAACQAESRDGVQFNKTFVGRDFVANCPANYTGSVRRYCNQGAVWGQFVLSNCTRASLSETITAAGELANASLSAEEITHKVELIVANLNTSLATNSTLISGDIKNVLGIFNTIGGALNKPGAVVTKATLEMFVDISSAMVETKGQVWSELRDDNVDQTAVLLYSLERITATSLRTLSNISIVRSSVAIALYAGAEEINFPQTSDLLEWNNQIFLPKDALKDKVNYSVIVYKQLADKIQISRENQKNYSQGLELLSKTMNSDIMSISIPNTKISKPVELTLALNQDNLTSPSCAFLNTTISNPEVGVWSTGGCQVKSVTSTHVVCSCDHLTNFAVLMSPYASSEDSLALSIISAIGCAISLFCLVITIIVYIVVWKYVKNDRSVLHVNLCVCLIAGYIIFLAGVDRTDDPAGCTVVAALLHFFFLAVFFIMLGEGIEIMKSVIVVFTSRSILVYLLAVAYGVPVVIVAISLGVTKTEGYGNEMSCWLSVDSGLIWAFIGPVLFVFVANLIILIVVIRAIQTSQIMRDKSTKEKVKSVARSICVLSPILGITWIFGVLSVSKETVVFQYLFAIFNSLQGLFIFIFQCFLQHQVRDGVKALRRKYYAVSLDSSHKKSSSNTNRYSESNSNTASQSKNVSSGSTQSTYEVGSPVTDHKPNFNQIKNPAFHETLETKRSNKSARSSSEKSERSASSNDSRRPFDKFDESHEDHFIYLRGGSYYGDINPNFVQIPGYSIENNKVNHDQIDADQNQDKFGSTKKEAWHLVSRKRKSGQEENPEIEKERLKQIYGKVNAINGLQNNENLTANQIKARERWKKVQNFTKSPERAFTKAELFGARMANTEDFTLSPNGSVSSSSKKSSKTSKRPNLTPLIIPRPMTFPLPEPDYHSSI
ncbi:uncharacterized protein LOC131940023 isoform X2 [Physella acuta]|uniref:uncharacterized protein LOC131940023 isoform X2 n=1 Tax=Physella acuta TaxID=109671 RepID=UPI0027DB36F7|nr:uncharacterized protein LOC131940023 isoform X2 [Physella acuta]